MKITTKETLRMLLLSLAKEESLNTYTLKNSLESILNTANCEKVVKRLPVDKQCRLVACLNDVCEITNVLPDYTMVVVLPMIAEPSWSCMRYRYPCEIYEYIDDNHNEFVYTSEDIGVQHFQSIDVVASECPTAITDVGKMYGCIDNNQQLALGSKHYRYVTWCGGFPHVYAFRLDKLWTGYGVEWRAYIERMPSLKTRDDSTHITHRHTDGNGKYWVCWDRPVETLKDMQSICRVWADSIQEYIATGKRFG